MTILPGSTLGVLGGGQLGRMFAQAAQTLGYRVHVYEPQAECPAGAVANREFNAPYADAAALQEFARGCDVVTYEFENIPAAPLEQIGSLTRLYPRPGVLEICQNRLREKTWLRREGFPHVPFAEVTADGDLAAAVRRIGCPCVIKTADFGYDGKGQQKVTDEAALERAVAQFAGQHVVVERFVDFRCELSVVVARSAAGESLAFPVAENIHTNHILDFSIVPARVNEAIRREAEELGRAIVERLDVVGLLAIELFLAADGRLLVNELAPRPHNSGHYTLDACATSQFEQHVRAVCGLPLGSPALESPVVMVNILGDAWQWSEGKVVAAPDWAALLADPKTKLHLYGKKEPRRGRKMGHFTVRDADVAVALERARTLKAALLAPATRA